jgi:DNA polymerase III gamma/tau subunit
MKSDVYVMPNESDYKIYIVESADKMTVEAQNAFLKIFEEPPAGVFFFLLCDNASVLLSTVRSRAPVLRMETFDSGTLSDYLIDHNEKAKKLFERDRDAFALLIRSSAGAIGEAIRRLGDTEDSAYAIKKKTDELP